MESVSLPAGITGRANPKSSTGRIDVFTRLVTDHGRAFDDLPEGYDGPLWLEISPRTFPILARPGDRLAQLRLRRGKPQNPGDLTVSIDMDVREGGPVGWRAKHHAGLVDLRGLAGHEVADYWEPLYPHRGRLVRNPEDFYILASRESVSVATGQAAEMAPIAPELGEFRAHYAGFFDPGFGHSAAGGEGSRAVLEVRSHDVPFILEDGQIVGRLVYERMAGVPDRLYGAELSSNYQAQGLKLSKHFA